MEKTTAHNSSNTDTHFVDMAKLKLSKRVSCVRSIVFAACWYVPFAAKNESFEEASGTSFHSGKNNGGVAAHVIHYKLFSTSHQ